MPQWDSPKILCSDNLDEFTQEFTNGLLLLGIKHTTSSPLNSQSNGRAEQEVQRLRLNLNKNPPTSDLQIQLTLLKLNQLFSSDRNIYSPFITFFKLKPNNQIPTLLPTEMSQTLTQVADRE